VTRKSLSQRTKGRKSITTIRQTTLRFQVENQESAKIILADPECYGADSLMAQWARRILPELGHEPFNLSNEELAEVAA